MNNLSFPVGTACVLVCGPKKYPARVVADDVKGDRPLLVIYTFEIGGEERELPFQMTREGKAPGSYLERVPVVRYEYQNVWAKKTVGHYRYDSLEILKKSSSSLEKRLGILEFKYEDDVLVDVRLTNDL